MPQTHEKALLGFGRTLVTASASNLVAPSMRDALRITQPFYVHGLMIGTGVMNCLHLLR